MFVQTNPEASLYSHGGGLTMVASLRMMGYPRGDGSCLSWAMKLRTLGRPKHMDAFLILYLSSKRGQILANLTEMIKE